MSLAQFPSFPPPPNLPRTSPPTTQSQITSSANGGHRACCENGRPILTDPHTGQTVCSCQYPPGLVSYPRAALPPGLETVYSASAYAAAVSQGYVALGTEGSAFYSPLGTSPYELKDSAEAWRQLAASQPGFPYDPMAMYPYGPGKNATRENTNTLKAWLYEHRKNPYPTKGEKIMLAIITKMTLTQVSTWFANARRRLKKENKMTWSPRNKPGDNDDADDDDSKDKGDNDDSDEDNAGGKSPKDEQKSCDREGQLSDDVTDGSSPSSSMRTVRMYDTPPESSHMSRSHLSSQPHLHDPGLSRRPPGFAPPQMPVEGPPSFLNLPPVTHGYGNVGQGRGMASPNSCNIAPSGANMTSAMDSTSSLKSPDSLCSNSDDSGLSDVTCGYPDPVQGSRDGLRPKIWSLAHVATSDAGYMTNGPASNGINSSNGSHRNLNSHVTGIQLGPMSNGGFPTGHMGSGHLGHDNPQSTVISPSSAMPSLGMTSPSSMSPLHSGMPHWGSMYGGPPVLGGSFGKPSCQGGAIFSQSLSGMPQGGHNMTSGPVNTLSGLHCSSPSAAYNQNMTAPTGYYSNLKSGLD